MTRPVVLETSLTGWPVRRGKVRDVYDLGSQLLLVATDRISAFDWVLPGGIPDKGRVLTQLSAFWFDLLAEPHHLISSQLDAAPLANLPERESLEGRSMRVKKTQVVPVECVVRGYLSGSGWKEYAQAGTVCGIRLPPGLRESDRLAEPIFTPATKAESGHDENISFDQMVAAVGPGVADELRRRSLALYARGAAHAAGRGIIIADTKFEWGMAPAEQPGQAGALILIDEALTPDSSRFWPADQYHPGQGQPSFDKQFVRDWLETSGWDKNSPPPPLPADVVARTRAKYIEAYEILTGQPFAWK